MILFEVKGKRFSGFDKIEVETSLDSITGNFTIATAGNIPSDFLDGIQKAAVKIIIEEEQVLNGFVDTINIDYTPTSHILTISGRDKTSDILDSTIGESLNFQGTKKLEDIIKQTLSIHKITGIEVINEVSDLADFEEIEISTPTPGDKIFAFLALLAKRKQVFLTTDGKGNIIISRSSGIRIEEKLINLSGNPNGNLKRGNISFNFANRFNRYKTMSQENTGKAGILVSFFSSASIEDSGDKISVDSAIRESRSLTTIEEESYTKKQAQNKADWQNNFRQIEGLSYSLTVANHRRAPSSGIWRPGQLVVIEDDFTETQALMLINRVVYNEDTTTGETSQIELVRKDAYQVQAEEPIKDKKSNKLGGLF